MSLPTWKAAQPDLDVTIADGSSYETAVESELTRVLQGYTRAATEYSKVTGTLWERIGTSLQGGKRARPRLVKLGYDAFALPNSHASSEHSGDRVVLLGCAFELLHTSLLMHDDVIDRDFTRRGRPTLSALYRNEAIDAGKSRPEAEHTGHSAAIIAGDLLLSAAISLALRAGRSLPQETALETSFQLAIHHAGAGELEDLLYSLTRSPAKVHQVLRMEELKTASYSFKFPLQAGALLAGATVKEAESLARVGGQLGLAYQLIDDVLGTFGDPHSTGKSVDSDLREGKSTILTALAAAQPAFSESLTRLRTQSPALSSLRSVLEAADAESLARQLAQDLCEDALRSARQLELPSTVSDQLNTFATLILTRGA